MLEPFCIPDLAVAHTLEEQIDIEILQEPLPETPY